jgi:Ca-activated chloride channel family protein
MKALSLLLILLFGLQAYSQEAAIQRGNAAFREGNFTLAETEYRRSGDNPVAVYNLANALIRQNRYDEALAALAPLTSQTKFPNIRQRAYYNTGVIYSRQKAIEQSIDAYKNALRLDPKDQFARENLQKALLELKQGGGGGGSDKPNDSNADKKLKELEDKERKLQQSKKQKGEGEEQGKDW